MVKSRYTFHKREREKARKKKQEEKAVRRTEARKLREDGLTGVSEEDPDIAGMQPGPQPFPEREDEGNNNPTVDGKEG